MSTRSSSKRMSSKDFKNIEVTQAMLDRYDRIWDTQKVKPKSPDSKPSATLIDRPSSAVDRKSLDESLLSQRMASLSRPSTSFTAQRPKESVGSAYKAVAKPKAKESQSSIRARATEFAKKQGTESFQRPIDPAKKGTGPSYDEPFRKRTDEEAWEQMKAISRSFIKPPSVIIDNFLYMGGVKNFPAMEKKPFEFESFTHVVFALNNPSDKSPYPHEEGYHCAITDKLDADITPFLEPTSDFIDKALRSHGPRARILVHCMHGRSRSGSITIAFIMRHLNITLKEAFKLVCEARPDAKPNVAFCYQLMAYEMKLKRRAVPSISMKEIKEKDWATALWALNDPDYNINKGGYKGPAF